jgi:hypothetical protein
MNRNSIMMLAMVVASSGLLPAQKADPFSMEIRQMYGHVKNNLAKMAEKMPAENYSFKPTAEVRTFGQIVGHVADVQAHLLSRERRAEVLECFVEDDESRSGGGAQGVLFPMRRSF